ncbi:MAG: HAD family phosphatase [Muribaculaceae bacterium]|nr:HAD family phosphatase [Muribaculaceae bacterium]
MSDKSFGVLFDLDGVLIDSESQYTSFWDSMEHVYPTGVPDYAIAIKGTTLTKILQNYPPEVRDDIVRRVNEFEDNMSFPVYEGVMDFLDDLRRNGIPAAIVTSSDNMKMSKLYRQHPDFADHFDAVIVGDMVSRSKPDPEGYLLGAKALGCDPANCFVFEDSLQGLEAGRASGATVIALATTYGAAELAGKAKAIISGFSGFTVSDMMALKNL